MGKLTFVLIGGLSCSGKTTFAKDLLAFFSASSDTDNCKCIGIYNFDDFYFPNVESGWDLPCAFDMNRFNQELRANIINECSERENAFTAAKPDVFVIIEGIPVFHWYNRYFKQLIFIDSCQSGSENCKITNTFAIQSLHILFNITNNKDINICRARRSTRTDILLKTIPGFLPEQPSYFIDSVVPEFKVHTIDEYNKIIPSKNTVKISEDSCYSENTKGKLLSKVSTFLNGKKKD